MLPRPVYEELTRREAESGVYRTRIAAAILCEHLIGAVVDRELRAVGQQPPNATEPPIKRMPSPFANFDW